MFRRMEKGDRVTGDALSAHSIGATVKRYAEKAGYKPEDLGGGHSLRAGLATSAAERGASIFRIDIHAESSPEHKTLKGAKLSPRDRHVSFVFFHHAGILTLYTALTIGMTYPIAFKLNSDLAAYSADGHTFYWLLWWFKKSIVDLGTSPLYTNLLFYPDGVSFANHVLTPFTGFLGIPLQQFFGLTATFKERGVSGSVPLSKRPKGKDLLTKVQPGDVVIVHRLDRMFRSSADALNIVESLKDKNVELHILNLGFGNIWGNSVGQLFLTIMSAVAQFDNELRAERIREGKNRKKEKGEFAGGGVPYGFVLKMEEKNGKEVEVLEKDPGQQKALREMKRLREEGLSYRKIADQVSQKYAKISYEGVRRVLSR